ncbi:hypothetical protein QTP88_005518 [Uroleucon formosanum]
MDGRKRLSGSQYKKLAKEKSKREEEVLLKSAEEIRPTPPIEELKKSDENNGSTISKETGLSLFVPPASAPTTDTSQEKQESVFTFSDDPAQWVVINDYFRDYIAKHGCNQNKNADFKLSRRNLKDRASVLGKIDHDFTAQLDKEISYWREVIKRVVAAVKTLVSQKIGLKNNGNFLMLLKFLSEFDPFMNEHIKNYANKSRGSTSYFKGDNFAEVKKAKYYSIIVDSTPDISHVDQLAFILRYVLPNGVAVERFVKLLDNVEHKGTDTYNAVKETLKTLQINFNDLRGQSYDNAANMSDNPLAQFTPCAGHGLNTVGTHAAECCPEAISFFDLNQNLYNFFSESPARWNILQSFANSKNITLKSLSNTRWSARANAVDMLYTEIYGALKSIEENLLEKAATKNTANSLRRKLEHLEIAIMVNVWNVILDHFNVVSQKIQNVSTSMSEVLDLYKSLVDLAKNIRNNFDHYEEKALKMSINKVYKNEMKGKKYRRLHADETNEGQVEFNGRSDFKINTFIPIMDKIRDQLENKYELYRDIFQKFTALLRFGELDETDLREEAESFTNELIHFKLYCKSIEKDSPSKLLQHIRDHDLTSVFPNIDISYRLFNCMPVTNCNAERSFSCLKRIENCLRSATLETRLNSLMLLNIEAEILTALNFDDLIDTFTQQKARRKFF